MEKKKQTWLLIKQINNYLLHYQKLRNEDKQNYYLQRQELKKADSLASLITDCLDEEKKELQTTIQKLCSILENLHYIKFLQKSFNELTSSKEKTKILEKLQEEFQKLSKLRGLSENETKIQKTIEQNIKLIQLGKNNENLLIINESQTGVKLLPLKREARKE